MPKPLNERLSTFVYKLHKEQPTPKPPTQQTNKQKVNKRNKQTTQETTQQTDKQKVNKFSEIRYKKQRNNPIYKYGDISKTNLMNELTTIEQPPRYDLIKYCLHKYPCVGIINNILSLDENSGEYKLLSYNVVIWLKDHEEITQHMETFKTIIKRRIFIHKSPLKLPNKNDNLYNTLISMYNYYCKNQIDIFINHISKKFDFDLSRLINYCKENNLYKLLLVSLCASYSNDCIKRQTNKNLYKYCDQKYKQNHLYHSFIENMKNINDSFDIDKYMKPFITHVYLSNIDLIPLNNNIYVYNNEMFYKINIDDITKWKQAKKIRSVLSIDVNFIDYLIEIDYEIYLCHTWYDEYIDKKINNDYINILLFWYIVNYYGLYIYIDTETNKLYSPWCLYNSVSTFDKHNDLYKLLIENININDVDKYINIIFESDLFDIKNEILNRLSILKNDIINKHDDK